MRRQRFFAIFTAISGATMMFSCTAILGVTDVPNPDDLRSATSEAGDDAPLGDAPDDILEAAPVCELASCAPVFEVPQSSTSTTTFDGDGGNYLLSMLIGDPNPADASSGFRIEMSLADASTSVSADGPNFDVTQEIAITSDPINFTASGEGKFVDGYLTPGACDAGVGPFVYKVTFDTVVSLDGGDDAAAVGCSSYSSVTAEQTGSDAGSTFLIAPLNVCITSGNAGLDMTPGILDSVQVAAGRYLENQSDEALIDAIESHECRSDYVNPDN